jgi:hypothetical protein
MYSDIIPPKKNSFIKAKKDDHEVRIIKEEAFYHTVDGRDKKSRLPLILIFLTVVIMGIVYYSAYSNNTNILFESKSTIFEIKDIIPMTLSEKNQNSSTTLSYNLIYNNENKDRNVFAPVEDATTTATTTSTSVSKVEFYYLNNGTSTSSTTPKKVSFVNETNSDVKIVKNTRINVEGVTYYLDKDINIKKGDKVSNSTTSKYKVIGFKGSEKYDKFYAIDYADNTADVAPVVTDGKNFPSNDLLSLIPENFIPLKKNYIFDKRLNQTALVVVDKRDFERVLVNSSKLIQEYIKVFKPISDLVEYEINIDDYELQLDMETGLPVSFKNLNLEIIPRIKRDKVATIFKGFSKGTMKEIKVGVQKYLNIEVTYSPFWMNKVSDENHISVEVK